MRLSLSSGQAVTSYLDILGKLARHQSETLTFTVRRSGKGKSDGPPQELEITVPPNPVKWFGIETRDGKNHGRAARLAGGRSQHQAGGSA